MAALVAVAVLVVGVARSGALYFECGMMGAMLVDACCVADHQDDRREDGPAIEAAPCCKGRRLTTLPSAAAAKGLNVHGAPLADVLPPYTESAASPPVESAIVLGYDARAGPSSPSRRRASIMIWNC